jgi:tetratricopeptide (TPR) repeat protein
MVVTQYQEVAGGAFPVHFRATGSGYHQALALEIVDVVANASVSDSAFRPDLRGLVFLHEGLAPDALRAKLTGETDPAVKAGLEYSLAVRLSRDAGGRAEAKEACQRAIELAPDTVAPRLLLADLTGGEPSDSAASGLESLLERFPASRDAIYPRLLEPMLRREGGDLRPATDLVAKWRKDCPDSLGAIGMAIRVGQRNRDPAALLELDKSLANGVSAPLRLQYRTSIVRALVSLGETNQAGRVLAAVTAAVLDPGDSPAAPYVVRELRVLHEKAGSLNGFMQDLSERHAKAPRNTVVLSLLANVSMEGKDYARAAGYCGALRELEPQNPVWIGLLAQVYQRQNDQTQLVALCESVLASPPDGLRETLEPQLLAAYRAAGQQAKAESLATRLLSDTNCPRQTLDALARHFEEQKATAKAIDVYRRLARQSEDGTGRRYYLSQFLRLCLDGERLDEAKGALDELEKSGDPRSSVGDPVGLGELAHLRIAYLKKADGLDAYVAEAERQAADKTNDLGQVRQFASVCVAAGQWDKAAGCYRRLVAAKPDESDFDTLVMCLQRLERHKEVVDAYEAFLDKIPRARRNRLSSLIYACRAANDPDRALAAVRRYAQDASSDAWQSVGSFMAESRRGDDAAEAWAKALELERDEGRRVRLRLQLAKAYAGQKKAAESEALLREVAGVASDEYTASLVNEAVSEYARLLKGTGRLDYTIAELRQRTAKAPAKVDLVLLAGLLRESGDRAGAAGCLGQLAKLDPAPARILDWANALAEQQDYARQAEVLAQFLAAHPDQRERHLRTLANAYQRAGKADQAIEAARTWTTDQAGNPRAWGTLADVLRQAKRWDEALQALDKALACSEGNSKKFHYQLTRGRLLVEQGKPAEAQKWFEGLLADAKDESTRSQLNRELLESCRSSGTLPDLIAVLEKTVQQKPGDKEALAQLIDALASGRQNAVAAARAGVLAKLAPTESNFSRWLDLLESSEQPQAFAVACEEFFTRFPHRRTGYPLGRLAEAYLRAGEKDKAVAAAREYAGKSTNEPAAFAILARVCAGAGATDEAGKAYDRAAEVSRSEGERWQYGMSKVELLKQAGRFAEAKPVIEKLVREANQAGNRQWAERVLLDVLAGCGELDATLATLEARATKDPNESDVRLVASIYSNKRDNRKAVEWFRKLVALKPDRDSYGQLMGAVGGLEDPAAQVALYEEVIGKFPEHKGDYLNGLMWAYQRAGRLDDAVRIGEEQARSKPKDIDSLRSLGGICRAARRYDQAIASYRTALELAGGGSSRPQALWELADTLREAGRVDEALREVEALLAAKPDGYLAGQAAQLQMQLLKEAGKWDGHVKALEAQAGQATNETVLLQLASSYTEKGEVAAAADIYERLVRLNPTSGNYGKWAVALQQAKAYPKEVAALTEFLAKYPGEKYVFLDALARAYEHVGDLSNAVNVARECLQAKNQKDYANRELARLLIVAGRAAEAVPVLELAVKLADSDMTRQLWTADLLTLYLDMKESAKAEATLISLLQQRARSATTYGGEDVLKRALRELSERNAGLTDGLLRAADEHLDDYPAQVTAAELCRLQGKPDRQKEYRRRGMEIQCRTADAAPADYDKQVAAGGACMAAGECSHAVGFYRRAVEARPSPAVYEQLASAHAASRDFAGQAAVLEELLQKYPQARNSVSMLVFAYQSAGQTDKAIQTAKAAVDRGPDPMGNARATLANVCALAGRFDEATAAYRALRVEAGRQGRSSFLSRQTDYVARQIGESYVKLGDRAKGLEFLRSVHDEVTETTAKARIDKLLADLTAPVAPTPDGDP